MDEPEPVEPDVVEPIEEDDIFNDEETETEEEPDDTPEPEEPEPAPTPLCDDGSPLPCAPPPPQECDDVHDSLAATSTTIDAITAMIDAYIGELYYLN